MSIYTRADYMEKRVDHQTYHLAIAKAAGIGYARSAMLPEIRAALERGDEHLNSIPLEWWDCLAMASRGAITRALRQFPGERFSLGVGVCVHKAAARAAALAMDVEPQP